MQSQAAIKTLGLQSARFMEVLARLYSLRAFLKMQTQIRFMDAKHLIVELICHIFAISSSSRYGGRKGTLSI